MYAVKPNYLDIFWNAVALLAKKLGKHVSMIIRMCKNTIEGQGIVGSFMFIQKVFHLDRQVLIVKHIKVIRFKSVFAAGIKISIFSFIGFARKDRMKAYVDRMTAAKFQQLFNGKACARKIVRGNSRNYVIFKETVENNNGKILSDTFMPKS